MIPKDRLHCPLRTLSLAGPQLARRSLLLQQADELDTQHDGPEKLCYSNAPYTYRDSSAFSFRKPLLVFAAFLFTRSFQALIPTTEVGSTRKGNVLFSSALFFQRLLFSIGLS